MDNNPCTTDTCDPRAGCLHAAVTNGTPCSDGNLCNGLETCQGGACSPGTPLNCGSAGATAACDPLLGCPVDVMVAAHKLALRMNASAVQLKVSVKGTIAVTDASANGSAGDPVLHGGSLRMVFADGMLDGVYPLPASNWRYAGPPGSNQGYRYRDSALALGPVKGVSVRDLKTTGVAAFWPRAGVPLAQNPSPVGVVLRLGGTRYCMSFGGTTVFVPELHFGGTDAPAPAACPP